MDDGRVGSGRAVIVLSADAESLEDDVELLMIDLGVSEVRARNDRGGDLEPSRVEVGRLALSSGPVRIELDAVPATYGAARVQLDEGAWGHAVELRVREGDTTWHLLADEPVVIDARCAVPVQLDPDGTVEIAASIDLGEVHQHLRESGLPRPADGTIVVDRERASAVLDEVLAELREHVRSTCQAGVDD
jgi:hypothetical protein